MVIGEPASHGLGNLVFISGQVPVVDGTPSHLDLNTFVLTRTPYDPGAPIPGGLDPAGWRGTKA